MPLSSVFSCKLNNHYKKALQNINVKRVQAQYDWADDEIIFQNNKLRLKFETKENQLSCCGITELVFHGWFYKTKGYPNLSDEDFNSIVAAYIKSVGPRGQDDQRILIIGIPVNVKTTSVYRGPFYPRLMKTLLKFGFKKANNVPYLNKNSMNKLIVLVGQKP